jgi:peptidyl-prolyl cis-trans isomerase SurA
MRLRPFVFALALATAGSLARDASAVIVERVVAVVGDEPILLSELRTRARPFLLQIQERVPEGAQRAAAESQVLRDLVQKMIDEKLEEQSARKANVTVSSEEIDNAFRTIGTQQGITVDEVFRLARAKSGVGEVEYREEIRRQLLEGKMLQLRVKGRVRITDEDVRATFERVRREERKRLEYHPAWVVVRVPPGATREAKEERRALAEQLAARARGGEDFAALARLYSDDARTKEAGGDLDTRAPEGSPAALAGRRDVLAPDLEAAVLNLEPGGVTAPIFVADAFVVLKLLSRQKSRYTTLEAAEPEMEARVQSEIFEKARRKWLEELRRRTHVEERL